MSTKGFAIVLLSCTVLALPYIAFGQPIQVAGTLDTSFNPNGYWIKADGSSITGGYQGSIIIDLGGFDFAYSVDSYSFQSAGGRILIGGTVLGLGGGNNFALVALTENGTLDSSFNPSGDWISATGTSYMPPAGFGYPGSIVIDLGREDFGQSVTTFQADGQRILIGGTTTTGPNPSNFALVVLTETGVLDRSFNPSGYWITQSGVSIPGGYPGSIIVDLGGFEDGKSIVTFQSDGQRILIGGSTSLGLNPINFALVALTETGALDDSFNPEGNWIDSSGQPYNDGGYPGSIVIDLGGAEYGYSVNSYSFQSDGQRILIGGLTNAGPPSSGNNFALVALTETGSLDSSFNSSGLLIQANGDFVTGGYAGSIIIDLGGDDQGQSIATFQSDGQRILIGGSTNTGPDPFNFALVALTESGALDKSFNPSGLWIQASGDFITGGYAGSIIIDLGGDDFGQSVVSFQSDGQRIIIGGFTNVGLNPRNFALIALTETGALDSSFNPSGLWISSTGGSVIPPTGFGYPGSIIVDLGGDEYSRSITTFQSDGQRIIIGGDTSIGPGIFPRNFALVALNGETIFPPLPPLNPLLYLPFVAMAAA